MDEKTAEEIAQDYTAMGHSVDLINAIIAGTAMADDEAEDKEQEIAKDQEEADEINTELDRIKQLANI